MYPMSTIKIIIFKEKENALAFPLPSFQEANDDFPYPSNLYDNIFKSIISYHL
jgi:hypothetical protein